MLQTHARKHQWSLLMFITLSCEWRDWWKRLSPTGHRVLMRHLAMQRGQGNMKEWKDVCTEHVVSCPVVIEKRGNSIHEVAHKIWLAKCYTKHALGSHLSSLSAASIKLWTTTLALSLILAISNCLDMFGYYVFVLHLLSMIVSHSTVHSHRLCYNISITIPGVFNTYLMNFIHLNHVIHAVTEASRRIKEWKMIDKAWVIFLLSLPRHWTIVDVGGCFGIFCRLVS